MSGFVHVWLLSPNLCNQVVGETALLEEYNPIHLIVFMYCCIIVKNKFALRILFISKYGTSAFGQGWRPRLRCPRRLRGVVGLAVSVLCKFGIYFLFKC